jgi:DNA transformation protein
MASRSEDAAFIEDALQGLGPVEIRAMFGGHGVFLDGVMFGLIADGDLYLKVDDHNRDSFTQAGLAAFEYRGKGSPITMSYHRAPEPIEEWTQLEPFARGALDAARRAAVARRPRRDRT